MVLFKFQGVFLEFHCQGKYTGMLPNKPNITKTTFSQTKNRSQIIFLLVYRLTV